MPKILAILGAHKKKAAGNPSFGKQEEPALDILEQKPAIRVRELAERIRGSPHFAEGMLPLLNDVMSIEHRFKTADERIDTSDMVRRDALESFCAIVECNSFGKSLEPLMEEMHRKFMAMKAEGATMDSMISELNALGTNRDLGMSLLWSIKHLRKLAENPALGDAYAGLAETIAKRRSFSHMHFSFRIMDAMLESRGMKRLSKDSARFSASFTSLSDSMEKGICAFQGNEPSQFYAYVERMLLCGALGWRALPIFVAYLDDMATAPRPSAAGGMDVESYSRWMTKSMSTFESVLCSGHFSAATRDALISASEIGNPMLVFGAVKSLDPLLATGPAGRHARLIKLVSKKASPDSLERAYRSLGSLSRCRAFRGRLVSAVKNAVGIMDSDKIPDFLGAVARIVGQGQNDAKGMDTKTISSLANLVMKGGSMHEPEKAISTFASISGHGSMKGKMRNALSDITKKESGDDLRFALISFYALLFDHAYSERLDAVVRLSVKNAGSGAVSDALDMVHAVSKSGNKGIEGVSTEMAEDIAAIANKVSTLDKMGRLYVEAERLLNERMKKGGFSAECLSEIAKALKDRKGREMLDALASH